MINFNTINKIRYDFISTRSIFQIIGEDFRIVIIFHFFRIFVHIIINL